VRGGKIAPAADDNSEFVEVANEAADDADLESGEE